ncbi:TRAP transporter substrate-binding protein [Desulfoferrobacter suflitae]|uniref:TRAP transporter substrate-binding protein n=1 Tax=Desulfoferrobacter suflitae TaxID=2865782 RepID=UPI0021640D7C|nr:TRAP transporter substrate-binding protein [Desulfoferrobacter suflitae]MCK8603407.1 TRAP transporter substrate-binding protein [Desulfoferrobacter suflitae]
MSLLSVLEMPKDQTAKVDKSRRDFIKKVGAVGAAAVATTAVSAPYVWAQGKTYNWKMVTTWPPELPILQTGSERFARRVEEMSNGRMKIQVYAGGELVPPLGTFDAVSQGTVECGSGAAYYWAGKVPAAQWFSAVPFGFNPQMINAWFYSGGGLQLWEEVYAPFNVVPRPQGNTGVQMGGWFNKKIESVDDFKGLKIRIPGLGGKVVAKAGATVVLLAGGEIYTSLERGVIDATEWVGPLHDLRMGFYQAAKYYYYPGWHEPGTCLEVIFNKKAYDALPSDLKAILDAAAAETNMWSLCEFESRNGEALETLVNEHKVELLRFPDSVLTDFQKLSAEVLEEEAEKDAAAKKVNEAFKAYRKKLGGWNKVSEKAYQDYIAFGPQQ